MESNEMAEMAMAKWGRSLLHPLKNVCRSAPRSPSAVRGASVLLVMAGEEEGLVGANSFSALLLALGPSQ